MRFHTRFPRLQNPEAGVGASPATLSGMLQLCTQLCHALERRLTRRLPLAIRREGIMQIMLWIGPTTYTRNPFQFKAGAESNKERFRSYIIGRQEKSRSARPKGSAAVKDLTIATRASAKLKTTCVPETGS